jgi:hypothetical protein
MCEVSSSEWTAQDHRPQIPQWEVAVELQGSSIGETASQDHSRPWLPLAIRNEISIIRVMTYHLATDRLFFAIGLANWVKCRLETLVLVGRADGRAALESVSLAESKL